MKKIVITGGSNGIGLECVKKFSANGYLVFILEPGLAVATSGATYLSKNPQWFGFFSAECHRPEALRY